MKFSFTKKISENAPKKPIETEKKEFITDFSNCSNRNSNEIFLKNNFSNKTTKKSPENKEEKRPQITKPIFQFKPRDIKDFVCNDTFQSNVPINSSEFTKLTRNLEKNESDTKFTAKKFHLPKKIKLNRVATTPKSNFKPQSIRSIEIPKKIVVGSIVKIVKGRHVNKIARIEFISEDESMCRVKIIDHQAKDDSKLIALHTACVRISIEKESTKEIIDRDREGRSEIEIKRNWIVRDLCVTIVDRSYRNGEFRGQSVVIDDIYDKDECACVTADGRLLYELTSAMLGFVGPRRGRLARVMGGVVSDKVVMVKEINEVRGTATVVVKADDYESDDDEERLQNKKNEIEIDLRLLCLMREK